MTDIELLTQKARRKAALAEAGLLPKPPVATIAPQIDHTLLVPEFSPEDIRRVCSEAVDRGFAAVCVPLAAVPVARAALENTTVRLCTAVSFPLGASPAISKACEAKWAMENGAAEIDVVLSLFPIKQKKKEETLEELSAVRDAVGKGCALKAILETPRLTPEEIITTVRLVSRAEFDFVETCTGFYKPATYFDVAMLVAAAPKNLRVKASGGIRTVPQILAYLSLGATRIGTSRALQILETA